MWYDIFFYIIGGAILIALAIKVWPITIIALTIFLFYKYKKKEAYETCDARIRDIQSTVDETNKKIKKMESRTIDIDQTVNDTQLELLQLRERLSELLRFQRFILVFAQGNQYHALKKITETISLTIEEKENLIENLESEKRLNDSCISNLKRDVEAKTKEIYTLQQKQESERKK